MANDISLTVLLPHELNLQLKTLSKDIGMTKTNLIRSAIHEFLTLEDINLDFSQGHDDKRDRLVLNVNQLTFNILEASCKKHNQSMNSIITATSILALEHFSKWLR